MKNLWLLVMVVASGLVWGEEREALRVEYSNGLPGEPPVAWMERYFSNDQGQITAIVREQFSTEKGQVASKARVDFQWTEGRVDWVDAEGGGWISFGRAPFKAQLGDLVRWITFGGSVSEPIWSDGQREWGWTPGRSYFSRTIEDNPVSKQQETRTTGARITKFAGNVPEEFCVVDIRPREVRGAIFGNFLDDNWTQSGNLVVSGAGIICFNDEVWQTDSIILNHRVPYPLWVRFLKIVQKS